MNKKKAIAFAITISGLGLCWLLIAGKSKPNINLERIKEIEKDVGCDFLFIANKDKKIRYRADDDFWSYKFQKEMLDSVEKHYKNKKQLMETCKKWKDNKLRFSRNENGLWITMKPKKVKRT